MNKPLSKCVFANRINLQPSGLSHNLFNFAYCSTSSSHLENAHMNDILFEKHEGYLTIYLKSPRSNTLLLNDMIHEILDLFERSLMLAATSASILNCYIYVRQPSKESSCIFSHISKENKLFMFVIRRSLDALTHSPANTSSTKPLLGNRNSSAPHHITYMLLWTSCSSKLGRQP